MKKIILFCLFMVASGASSAAAQEIEEILKKSDAALELMHSGSRKIEIIMRDGNKITKKWVARRAQKKFSDGIWNLMVIMEPKDMRGNAVLYSKTENRGLAQWVYLKSLRRTNKISYTDLYFPFFGTDFSYSDFDMGYPAGKYKFMGIEKYGDKMAFKTDVYPNVDFYYSHIISLVDKETYLPITRDYYDAAGKLWKAKKYEELVVIDDIPTYLRIKMVDVQNDRSTEFVFSEICHNVDILSKADFDPDKLQNAVDSSICKMRPSNGE